MSNCLPKSRGSVRIRADDFALVPRAEGPRDLERGAGLEEPDRAVGQGDVGPGGVEAVQPGETLAVPVAVAVVEHAIRILRVRGEERVTERMPVVAVEPEIAVPAPVAGAVRCGTGPEVGG